jgi:acyl transferase domain-containing protein
MSDIRQARIALVSRILKGPGEASTAERGGAFNNSGLAERLGRLADKVSKHASQVTDDDIAAATAGTNEDKVFEIVVCASVGQATRQYDAALAALDAATGKV